MLKIQRSIFNQLDFDFDAALREFAAAKEEHPSTVGVPAPSADSFVEAAFYAGGYEIVEPEPEPEPVIEKGPEFVPDPRRPAAIERLKKLEGQASDAQLAEMRSLLMLVLEMMPV